MTEWIFLGTGTSHGIPMIACECDVCRSQNPRNQRTRTSSLICHEGRNILIDPGIDFRTQALREKIDHLDAVLTTHGHADHIFGLDETRRFNHFQPEPIPVYADEPTLERLREVFSYVFNPVQEGGGIPQIVPNEIRGDFEVFGLPVRPLRIMHGLVPITAFRVGPVAYLTDCSAIPEETYAELAGVEWFIIGALREIPHATHFNIEQAVEAARRVGARQTYFVHVSHKLEYEATNASLPPGMELAYDGLRFRFEI
jgi:phosphoribosyl 1,2-cyclic phosphate phosphodiesterase